VDGRALLAFDGEYDLFGGSAHGRCRSVELLSGMSRTVGVKGLRLRSDVTNNQGAERQMTISNIAAEIWRQDWSV